jgi:hypothetical protein
MLTRKSAFDRHIIVCEIVHKPKWQRKCEEEESSDIPCVEKLYMIIQEMAYKQQKMEEKMDELQQIINKKKKKLNIMKWLNLNLRPNKLFDDCIKAFVVTEDDIQILMQDTFAQTVINILKNNLKPPKEATDKPPLTEKPTTVNPIVCFSEKASIFYIYKESEWSKMEPDEFFKMLGALHKKVLTGLCCWRDSNTEKLDKSDKLQDVYNKAVAKLMSASDFKQESTVSKIRTALYNHLKSELSMIEYDFEF